LSWNEGGSRGPATPDPPSSPLIPEPRHDRAAPPSYPRPGRDDAMSRFMMKQRWFSFGDDYKVLDAAGDEVFRIDGKVFCIGDQLSVQDMGGKELAYIDQKLLSWGPTYEIWRSGRL